MRKGKCAAVIDQVKQWVFMEWDHLSAQQREKGGTATKEMCFGVLPYTTEIGFISFGDFSYQNFI